MACLLMTTGEQSGVYFQLAKRPMAGGRDPATELQIIDPKVSRRHFVIRMVDEAFVIRELRSKNGVSVNGVRINGEHRLKDEDTIQVGATELVFRETDQPDKSNAVDQFRKSTPELREDRTLSD